MRRTFTFSLVLSALLSLISNELLANVRISVDSSSIHFGSVLLSNHQDIVITLTDTSDADVQIDGVSPFGAASADFGVTDPSFPAVIHAHETLAVTIRFTPNTTGVRSSLLSISTSDGNISLLMSGTGVTENSVLSFSITAIDMGKIAPNFVRDTVIELYSTGADSATIEGVVTNTSSFAAEIVGTTQTPIRLAPDDSVAVRITFTGLLSVGPKDGLLSVIGASDPSIALAGSVGYGAFSFVPTTVDFGPMYIGEIRDTEILLRNDADVDIEISVLDPPYGGAVTFIDAPTLPFLLPAGGSVAIGVRANPGDNTFNTPDISGVSSNVDGTQKAYFALSVKGAALDGPHSQQADFFCAKPGAIEVVVPVTDTVPTKFIITRIAALDSTVTVSDDRTLPDTLGGNETHDFALHISTRSVPKDTVVIAFFGDNQVVVLDTLFITGRSSTAITSLASLASIDTLHATYSVQTQSDLSQYSLDTVIVHVTVSDENTLEIDTASLALAAGLANAKILRIVPEALGYAVWIASSTPIVAPAGASLVTFNLRRFVSTADSASVNVLLESPERAGCLEWNSDRTAVPLLAMCGNGEIQAFLSNKSLPTIFVTQNPVIDGDLELTIQSGLPMSAHIEMKNVLGQVLLQSDQAFRAGPNTATFPVGAFKDGSYFVVVVFEDGRTASLKFTKL